MPLCGFYPVQNAAVFGICFFDIGFHCGEIVAVARTVVVHILIFARAVLPTETTHCKCHPVCVGAACACGVRWVSQQCSFNFSRGLFAAYRAFYAVCKLCRKLCALGEGFCGDIFFNVLFPFEGNAAVGVLKRVAESVGADGLNLFGTRFCIGARALDVEAV